MGGLLNPEGVEGSVKFTDVLSEGETFVLEAIRTVSANTEYGQGEFVLMRIRGQEKEVGIWGEYLIAQAKSATNADMGKEYKIIRQVVPDFSERPVKQLVPAEPF